MPSSYSGSSWQMLYRPEIPNWESGKSQRASLKMTDYISSEYKSSPLTMVQKGPLNIQGLEVNSKTEGPTTKQKAEFSREIGLTRT